MDEFSLIRRYFSGLTSASEGVDLGIGDDCALLDVPMGYELAVTTDTLIAGRHFPESTAPADIGWKALAVNLSDLAAMGAQPRWFTLALSLPAPDEAWLAGFSSGVKELADGHQVALVGGDTTRGPLSITITAMGVVPRGQSLCRSGAQAGDLVCVTGTLGDAALALQLLQQGRTESTLMQHLNRPVPRVVAGQALRGWAGAAIDLSDGLASDLRHVLDASGVGADIEPAKLPASLEFQRLAAGESGVQLQLAGGDDYELCVCLAPADLEHARHKLDVPLTPIGVITARAGLRYLDAQGYEMKLELQGYNHFA